MEVIVDLTESRVELADIEIELHPWGEIEFSVEGTISELDDEALEQLADSELSPTSVTFSRR